MKTLFGLSMLFFGLTFVGYAVADSSELTKIDVKTGTGKEATPGKMVRVHYTGWLFDKSAPIIKAKNLTAPVIAQVISLFH